MVGLRGMAITENASGVVPGAYNEPVKTYAPGSPERASIKAELKRQAVTRVDLSLVIGGAEWRTGLCEPVVMPHAHACILGDVHNARPADVEAAIASAKAAWPDWAAMSWRARAAIFLRAANLLCGPWRDRLNAATMLNQSKTVHQAEIDSAAELADFLRFNVSFMAQIFGTQPISAPGIWNAMDYRPLEGFVYAVSPFNFTAIAANLPTAPAMMGNTVIWKPSQYAALSAHYVMQLLRAAGLPDGVINLVHGEPAMVSDIVLSNRDLAGVHFTGSTSVFNRILARVGQGTYRNYPRVVGETGGKNFILAHETADVAALATAIVRGGFEYQGQKCSAASRVFVPRGMWPDLRDRLIAEIETIRIGDVCDFRNFMGAVIHRASWEKLTGVIAMARDAADMRVLAGGMADDREGYFVAPTLMQTDDPASRFLREEFFGPLVTAYVYDEDRFADVIGLIDKASDYGLTGAVFAHDRAAVAMASAGLRHAAGNFYINDKPTGAVVGQQPFGGGRASGTNDKAGSIWNLMRWLSPRTIKENFVPATDYRYAFMTEE